MTHVEGRVRSADVPSADPGLLRSGQYADRSNLDKRASIYRFRRPALDLQSWALGLVDLTPGTRVLDAGCGPGSYLEHLVDRQATAIGVDLSPGMAREAGRFAPTVAADVTALPFGDGSFDVVLAMHMLYHVEPPARAIEELRRVLHEGGVLVAATNGPGHLDGFDRVIRRATGLRTWARSMSRFSTDNGAAQLRTRFRQVEANEVQGELVVPDPEPVVDYVASIESFVAPQLPMAWPDAMAAIRAEVEQEISRTGAFRSVVRSGAFVCRQPHPLR